MPPAKHIAEKIYDDAASFGLFMSLIGMIVGCLAGIALFIGGVFVFLKKTKLTKSTTARVESTYCHQVTTTHNNESSTKNVCDLSISYVVQEEAHKNHVQESLHYRNGDSINIFYNPANPMDISTVIPNYKVGGGIMMGFGLVVVFFAIGQYWLSKRFKFAAAASGI